MNGGQTGKGKLEVWEDMTCDCQQCLFGSCSAWSLLENPTTKRGTFARENTKKRNFSCFFAHLIVPLSLFLSLEGTFARKFPKNCRFLRYFARLFVSLHAKYISNTDVDAVWPINRVIDSCLTVINRSQPVSALSYVKSIYH